MIKFHEKPCASHGLISYRYMGKYGWVMIGAENNNDALSEAARSIDGAPNIKQLQVWDKTKYVDVLSSQITLTD